MLKQIKNSEIAAKIGAALDTLYIWKNNKDERRRYRFEALTIGATLLENGFTKDEVFFLAAYRFKPDRKEMLNEMNRLRERVEQLESGLIDVGAKAENVIGRR